MGLEILHTYRGLSGTRAPPPPGQCAGSAYHRERASVQAFPLATTIAGCPTASGNLRLHRASGAGLGLIKLQRRIVASARQSSIFIVPSLT